MKVILFGQVGQANSTCKKLEEELGMEVEIHQEPLTKENLHLVHGFDALNIDYMPMNADFLQAIKDTGVKYVSTRSVGYDLIDLDAAKRIGLKMGNSSYSPHNVAEYTVMLILMCVRNAKRHLDGYVYQDFYTPDKQGRMLGNTTVGVLGTGRIGTTVIRILHAFGCRILAYDLYPNEEVKQYAEYVALDTLLAQSDIITLHMPSTKENRHMINAESVAKMKKGALLVNTARGALVETDTVLEGLESGQLGGAALDVLEEEVPYYKRNCAGEVIKSRSMNALQGMPNVILTGHNAWNTVDASDETLENSLRSCYWELTGQENPYRLV